VIFLNRDVDVATISPSSLHILRGADTLPYTLRTSNSKSIVIDAPLLPGLTYSVSATGQIRDVNGASFAATQRTFNTRSYSPVQIVPLAQAAMQRLLIAPSGAMHLFTIEDQGRTGKLYYSSCPTACGSPISWQTVIVDTAAAPTALSAILDASQALHVAYSADTNTAVKIASCPTNCATAASWSTGFVDSTTKSGVAVALGADSAGTRQLLDSNWSDGKLHYASCSSGCTVAANWNPGILPTNELNLQDLALAVGSAGVVHAVYRGQELGTGKSLIRYTMCQSACATTANWTSLTLESTSLPGSGSDLQIDPSGVLYHAYYLGGATLRYARCAANCLQLTNWSTINVDPAGEGIRVSLARRAGGHEALAYGGTSGGLALATCASDCGVAAHWRYRTLDPITNSGLFPSLTIDVNGQPRVATGRAGGQYAQ
jgi:hypothetical protein